MTEKETRLSTVALLYAGTVSMCGLLVLCGWWFSIPFLSQGSPKFPPVQPNTAFCFTALSFAVILGTKQCYKNVALILLLCAIGLSGLTLVEYLLHVDLHITYIVASAFTDQDGTVTSPRRMALNSTIALLCLSYATLKIIVDVRNANPALICSLALTAGSLGLVALIGYCFSLEHAYGWSGYTKMSPFSAMGFCFSAVAVICSLLSLTHGLHQGKGWWVAMLSLVIGIVTSLLLWAWVITAQASFIKNEVRFDAKTTLNILQYKLLADIDLLRSVSTFFSSSDDVTREDFKNFTRPLLANHPGITGVDWSPRVMSQERQQFEQTLRHDGFDVQSIQQLDGQGLLTPRIPGALYYPVQYSEPIEINKVAIGFDHYSDPVRSSVMDEAAKARQPRSTNLLRLFRTTSQTPEPSDFLIVLPSFKDELAILPGGFVVGVFRTPELIDNFLKGIPEVGFSISFYDNTQEKAFFTYESGETHQTLNILEQQDQFVDQESLSFAGKTWTLKFSPTEEHLDRLRSWTPTMVLFTGLSSTFILSFYILALRVKNDKVKGLVALRTAEISKLNTELEERVHSRTEELELTNENLAREVADRRQVEELLRGDAGRQQVVVATQQDIASSQADMDAVMALLLERAEEASGAEGSIIEIVDGQEMLYRAGSGSGKVYVGLRMSKALTLSGRAVRENKVLYAEDTETDDRVDRDACQKAGIRSIVVVPLQQHGKTFGILKVLSQYPHAFTEPDIVALQLMAGAMSSAMANADALKALKLSENALAEKNMLLEKATEFKSQFLANMSHEIRTPLTSIIGYSESLMQDDFTAEESSFALSTVLRNSRHLLGIINDILDLSKIEAGKMEIETLEVSIFDIISDVGNLMQHKAMEQGIGFGFEYEFPLPNLIHTDPLRLKQILINLVGNAIKFTKKGKVTVVVTPLPKSQSVSFAVTDTGVGMTRQQKEKIFQSFTQADTTTTREFGGSGLGLVISQHLARKLGGDILAESVEGQGSTFTLTTFVGSSDEANMAYVKPNSRNEAQSKAAESVRMKGKILLAEDGPDNQKYISFVLKKAQLDFVVVSNGALAVAAVDAEHFDLILMDMQMPVMDGYTASKTLRKRGFSGPIVALTANIMKQDVDRCLQAGCTDFLGKPFERAIFYEMLARYLPSAEGNIPVTSKETILCEIDDPDYLPIITDFVNTLPVRLSDIEQAFDKKDFQTVSMLAHRLRGATMFGYPQLGRDAGMLEDAVAMKTFGDIPTRVAALKRVCEKILNGRPTIGSAAH